METEIADKFLSLEKEINSLKNFILNPRVQIKNLEGTFKTLSSAPSVSDFMDGSVILYDDGADRKIYAKINGVFYSATLT